MALLYGNSTVFSIYLHQMKKVYVENTVEVP